MAFLIIFVNSYIHSYAYICLQIYLWSGQAYLWLSQALSALK